MTALTVDHAPRVGVPVCGVSDAPTAQLVGLLHTHVFPVAAVHHAVGVAVAAAGGEHPARQASAVVIHVVQTGSLEPRGKHKATQRLVARFHKLTLKEMTMLK